MSDSIIHALAGAGGGVLAMTLTYPLIFLSTRAAVETKKHQTSALEAIKHVLREEGVTGIYSGLTSSLLGIAVTNGVYYYFYERSKSAIVKARPASAKGLSTLESMLASLIAGSATTIISNPIWVVQTTQAVRTANSPSSASTKEGGRPAPAPKKLGIIETVRHIIEKDGVGAFWRGVMPALVLVMNPILQYTVFEQLKNALVKRRTLIHRVRGSPSAAALTDVDFFFLGALSKLLATSTTYPYIVIKSRLQAGHSHYHSSIEGLLSIIRDEGISGLYRGVGSKLVQSVLTAAILFAGQRRMYELTKAAVAPVVRS